MHRSHFLLFCLLACAWAAPARSQTGVRVDSAPAAGGVAFTESRLPIVVVDTGGEPVPGAVKIDAFMGVIDNGPGKLNRLGDPYNGYEGRIGIELRGSSSLMFPKKQFAVETREPDGSNRNVELLGLPAENDWVFYAPYSDKSLIRNALIYDLARAMGRYASRSRFFDLVLNGDHRGVYVLLEKIKRDGDRVDIPRLDPDENEGDDLTGGYIIKIDKTDGEKVGGWRSPHPPYPGAQASILYQYHYPDPDEITDAQKSYIQSVVAGFEDHMARDVIDGYEERIDVASAVDFFLLNELSRNVDGYRLSTFMYKDRDSRDGRLVLGPIWDFNLAFGNANYYNGSAVAGWQVDFREARDPFQIPFWWQALMDDPAFTRRIRDRWEELRASVLHDDRLRARVDSLVAQVRPAVQQNFARWPVLGVYVWPNQFIGSSYEAEVDYLKDWLADRIAWMDAAIRNLSPGSGGDRGLVLEVFPNPVVDRGAVRFVLPEAGSIRLEVFNGLGRRMKTLVDGWHAGGAAQTDLGRLDAWPSGTYFVRLVYGSESVITSFVRLRAE